MTTVRDILTDSLREAKVIALAEQPTAEELQDALITFIRMMDSWSTESLTVSASSPKVFPLVAGKAAYTMGTGGDFNTARPAMIGQAYLRLSNANGQLELPIRVSTNYEDYAAITVKSVLSTYPFFLYDNNAAPLKTLTFWPVPAETNSVVLWVSDAISSATSLDDVLQLAPGYEDAIMTAMAVRLCSRNGLSASAELIEWARTSKATIQRANYQANTLSADRGLLGGNGMYNIYGDYINGQPPGGS